MDQQVSTMFISCPKRSEHRSVHGCIVIQETKNRKNQIVVVGGSESSVKSNSSILHRLACCIYTSKKFQ